MVRFLEVANAAEANAEIFDRVAGVPRGERVTQYWAPVVRDPDGGGEALAIEGELESPLTASEVAGLVEFEGLGGGLRSYCMIVYMAALLAEGRLDGGLIIVLFDEMPAAQRAELKGQLVEDPALAVDFFALLNAGQEKKIRDELGPPL